MALEYHLIRIPEDIKVNLEYNVYKKYPKLITDFTLYHGRIVEKITWLNAFYYYAGNTIVDVDRRIELAHESAMEGWSSYLLDLFCYYLEENGIEEDIDDLVTTLNDMWFDLEQVFDIFIANYYRPCIPDVDTVIRNSKHFEFHDYIGNEYIMLTKPVN